MSQQEVLKRLECPNCGSPINQLMPNTQTLVCGNCGSHVAVGAGDAEVLNKGGRKLPPSPVPIDLGDNIKLLGDEYFVMGRVIYRGWEPGDTSDYWVWNEWLLGAKSGQMLWLTHDENGLALFRKIRFRSQFDAKTSRTLEIGDGKKAFINERYPAQIVGAEGELTWRATRGEQLWVAEGAGFGKKYSIQQMESELEVHEGKAIEEIELADAAGNETWKSEIKNRANWGLTFGLVALLCIVFGVVALVGAAMANSTGDTIVNETITLTRNNPEATIPVNFSEAERPAIVGLNMQSSLPENSSLDVAITITSPDNTETELFETEFWHETGRDEDGPWREWSYNGSDMFVPFQSGDHTMKFILGTTPIDTMTANVEIRANHIVPVWLIVYGIVVGAVGILMLFFAAKRSGN